MPLVPKRTKLRKCMRLRVKQLSPINLSPPFHAHELGRWISLARFISRRGVKRTQQSYHRLLDPKVDPVDREPRRVGDPIPRSRFDGSGKHCSFVRGGVQEAPTGQRLQAGYYAIGSPIGDRADDEHIGSDITGDISPAGTLAPPRTKLGPRARSAEEPEAYLVSPIPDGRGEDVPLPRIMKQPTDRGVTCRHIAASHIVNDPPTIGAQLLHADERRWANLVQEAILDPFPSTGECERRAVLSDSLQHRAKRSQVPLLRDDEGSHPERPVEGPPQHRRTQGTVGFARREFRRTPGTGQEDHCIACPENGRQPRRSQKGQRRLLKAPRRPVQSLLIASLASPREKADLVRSFPDPSRVGRAAARHCTVTLARRRLLTWPFMSVTNTS